MNLAKRVRVLLAAVFPRAAKPVKDGAADEIARRQAEIAERLQLLRKQAEAELGHRR